MATKLDNAHKGQLSDQLAEVYRVTSNGTRDISQVRRALQDIIESKFFEKISVPDGSPAWYVSPADQIERVWELNAAYAWGFEDSDLPFIPEFTPRTETEVLMLVVYLPKKGQQSGLQRTFDELWGLIEAPYGLTKWRWEELKSDSKYLRSAPGHSHRSGIRWVVFDPNAYHGTSPEYALTRRNEDNVRFAGVEGLMAALLFPTWATSWNGDSSPYPNLSGLQFYWNAGWSHVPCLDRWGDSLQLQLNADWAGHSHENFASPSVREC